MVVFEAKKFQILIKSDLSFHSFAAYDFGIIFKKLKSLIQGYKDSPLNFSSKSFTVLPLTFQS